MDYLPEFVCQLYGSQDFVTRLQSLQDGIIAAQIKFPAIPPNTEGEIVLQADDELVSLCGTIEELAAKGFKTDTLTPIYLNEIFIPICRKSDNKCVYLMRGIYEKTPADPTFPLAYHPHPNISCVVLPSYPGLENSRPPHSPQLFYFERVTLERLNFKSIQLFPIFKDVTPQSTEAKDVAMRIIRDGFVEQHDQTVHVDAETLNNYQVCTRLLANVVHLICFAQSPNTSPSDVIAEAFKQQIYVLDEETPALEHVSDIKFDDPRQILRMSLRMSVLAMSIIIYDNQISKLDRMDKAEQKNGPEIESLQKQMAQCNQRLQELETAEIHTCLEPKIEILREILNLENKVKNLQPKIKREDRETKRASFDQMIKSCVEQMTQIYAIIYNAKYFIQGQDTDGNPINAEEAEDFHRTCIDIFGDLLKVASVATTPLDKRATKSNFLLLHNRIDKIGKAAIDLHSMEGLIVGVYRSIPEARPLLNNMFEYARRTLGTSAGHTEPFLQASDMFDTYSAGLIQMSKRLIRANSQTKGEQLDLIVDRVRHVVASKRSHQASVGAVRHTLVPGHVLNH